VGGGNTEVSVSPSGDAALASGAVAALDGAVESIEGGVVGSFDVLVALIRGESSGAWERVQLHSTWLDPGERDRFPDLSLGPGGEWADVPLTHDAAEGIRVACELAEAYDLLPAPAGALALGMVWQADSGAGRALLESGELTHRELLDLMQVELLGTRLEGFEKLKLGHPTPDPALSPDLTTATGPGTPDAPAPDSSALPAEDPLLQGTLEGADFVGRRPPSGPWLFARGNSLLECHDLGGLDGPARRRAASEAALQLAFEEIPGAVPALSIEEKGDWLVVETPRFGEDLSRPLAGGAQGDRFAAGFCGKLLNEAARTLEAMHSRGLVHRSIRPETLVFDPGRGELRVAGFAIAGLVDEVALDRYRAPEAFAGEIGPAVDQYALAIVARAMLTVPGSPPLTAPIRRVLQRAAAPRPADRFPTVAEFGSELVAAIAAEAPRSLSERVAGLSLAKRTALTPAAIAAAGILVLLVVEAPGSSEAAELKLITTALALIIESGIVFAAVAIAAALRGRRRPFSLRLASNPFVPFAIFVVLFATGLGSPGDDAFWRLIRSLLFAYCGCALLAPSRATSGSWLVAALAIWERRSTWRLWVRRTAAAALAALVIVAVTGPAAAKHFWDDFRFPSESAGRLGPLIPVWNLRAALGSDDTAFACDKVMSAAASRDEQLCRSLARLAGAVQRADPASRSEDAFGMPGTVESYLVQELPGSPNHRFWRLLTPQRKVAGVIYTRGPNARQLIAMLTRSAPVADTGELRSTWLYEIVWNGSEWRVAEYRACRIAAPGEGKKPADCVISSTASRSELKHARRTLDAPPEGSR
jgi:hypothetical protein